MKKIILMLIVLTGLVMFTGCDCEKSSSNMINELVHVQLIGTDFECDGVLLSDHIGPKTNVLSIKCSDGTIVRNLNNFIIK